MKHIFSLIFIAFLSLAVSAMEKAPNTRGLVFLVDQKNFPSAANTLWDNLRAARVAWQTYGVYDHVYFVTGDDCRNGDKLKAVWAEAFANNDEIDYVSMVHGGGQWLKDEFDIPRDSQKLRLVYSEGCGGGNGMNEFVKKYGAMVAIGHNDADNVAPSASPFFSFKFLDHWCKGEPLEQALSSAWQDFIDDVQSPVGFKICKAIAGYSNVEEVILGTKVMFSYRDGVDLKTFTVHTPSSHSERSEDQIINEETVDKFNK